MAQLGDSIVKGDLHVVGDFTGNDNVKYQNKLGIAQGTANIALVSDIETNPRYYKLMEITMNKLGNNDLLATLAFEYCRETLATNKTFKLLTVSLRSNGTGTSCVVQNPTFRVVAQDISNYCDALCATYKNISGVITVSIYAIAKYSYHFAKLRLLDITTRTNTMPSYRTYDYYSANDAGILAIPSNEVIIPLENASPAVYSGTAEPASTLGNDGDIYLLLES